MTSSDRFYLQHVQSSNTFPPKIVDGLLEAERAFLIKNIPKQSKIIDIGCGEGRILHYLHDTASLLVGIDYSSWECRIAHHNIPRATIIRADARFLPIESNVFDYVICAFNTFGNFEDRKESILEEMLRVCLEGGNIFISVYSIHALPFQLELYTQNNLEVEEIGSDYVRLKQGLISERFSIEKLELFFSKYRYRIHDLSDIVYMVEILK